VAIKVVYFCTLQTDARSLPPSVCIRRQKTVVYERVCICSSYIVKDIENIETVQRRFTKPLSGFCALSYTERLKLLN